MAHPRWRTEPRPDDESRTLLFYKTCDGVTEVAVEIDTEPLMQGDGRGSRILIAHVLRDVRRHWRMVVAKRKAAASIPPLSALFPGLGKKEREKTALEKIGFMHKGR